MFKIIKIRMICLVLIFTIVFSGCSKVPEQRNGMATHDESALVPQATQASPKMPTIDQEEPLITDSSPYYSDDYDDKIKLDEEYSETSENKEPNILGDVLGVASSILSLLDGTDKNETKSKYNDDYITPTLQAMEAVYTCLSENDAEGIKDLLCPRAKELPDVDVEIQAVFAYFGGKLVSYDEGKRTVTVDRLSGAKDDFVWTETTAYGFLPGIVNDAGIEYDLSLTYCSVDVREPDLVGINAIGIEGVDGTRYFIGLYELGIVDTNSTQ